jgi:hypothetical protein
MKIARIIVPQDLYVYPDNRSDEISELQKGDIILYDDTFCLSYTEDDDNFEGPDILRSWVAIFEGRVGWISAWDKEEPAGIEVIS